MKLLSGALRIAHEPELKFPIEIAPNSLVMVWRPFTEECLFRNESSQKIFRNEIGEPMSYEISDSETRNTLEPIFKKNHISSPNSSLK